MPRGRRGAPASLSWAWLTDAPSGHDFVGSYGRVFDIIVLARPGDEWQSPSMITLESALFESGRPVLIAPPTSPRSLATNVLIAWNCSTEQARTMADAMPLLRLAERITICTVEGATVAGPSGEQMARTLKMNGIAAEPITLKPPASAAPAKRCSPRPKNSAATSSSRAPIRKAACGR